MTSINGENVEEVRENISLKTGAKKKSWLNCSCTGDCFGGSKLIIISFAGLTIAITISLIIQIHYGDYQIVPHGSVATDSTECSLIGVDILKRNGNAMDAAIASMLCLAVVNPHSTGLDARGSLMIYSHRNRLPPEIIDFSSVRVKEFENLPITRLVRGLAYAHKKYGKLPWREMVKPAANLASQGFIVNLPLAQAVTKMQVEHLFPTITAGRNVSFKQLGSLLHQIADIPENKLHEFASEKSEFQNTKVVQTTFNEHNIYVPDSPSIGPFLLQNLEEINNISFTQNDLTKPEFVYHIAKLLKKLYTDFEIDEKFHEGTSSNVAAMDTNDLYVSGVTGMFSLFGTQEMTPNGYLLDINSTYSMYNSLIPIIITDQNYICGRRILLGTGDISSATQIIINLLLGSENATSSIESPRFQMINSDIIGIENRRKLSFNDAVEIFLSTTFKIQYLKEPYSSCNIVEKVKDDLSSHSDSRGGGLAYRF